MPYSLNIAFSQLILFHIATIRENILFGSKMDRMRYNKVIQKCALDKDFKLLPHGDKTLAGELGCNLSGGLFANQIYLKKYK